MGGVLAVFLWQQVAADGTAGPRTAEPPPAHAAMAAPGLTARPD
jgi:hypothetical protein